MAEKTIDIQELIQDDHNLNRGTEAGAQLMEKSFRDLGAGRSILVDKDGRIIAGNKSQKAAIKAGIKTVRVIETTGDELIAVKRTDLSLDSPEGRQLAFADNLTTQVNLAWDEVELDHLHTEVEGFDTSDWGFDASQLAGLEPVVPKDEPTETEDEAIERKKREFDEKMANGELDEDDPEYQEFLKKFEAKKTTDDCYTPEVVYDAVADWVANEYNLSHANFVRPFYPGGDYQKERYKKTDIVVDNPPFSILSEILDFYNANGIRYFLFGPTMTIFGTAYNRCTALVIDVTCTYENGANVNASFLTNLEEKDIVCRAVPSLYNAVKAANDINIASLRKNVPKYAYPANLITAAFVGYLSKYGQELCVRREESQKVARLDSQESEGKTIFGSGYLVSDTIAEARKRAEEEARKRAEEEAKKKPWPLSDRERAIIASLSNN